MESNSETGPVLVALHWLDWPSVNDHRDVLEQHGYLPDMRFNKVIDRALTQAGLCRKDIYVAQAFHLLIALGRDAARACRRAGVEPIECIHPSARGRRMTVGRKAEVLAQMLLAVQRNAAVR